MFIHIISISWCMKLAVNNADVSIVSLSRDLCTHGHLLREHGSGFVANCATNKVLSCGFWRPPPHAGFHICSHFVHACINNNSASVGRSDSPAAVQPPWQTDSTNLLCFISRTEVVLWFSCFTALECTVERSQLKTHTQLFLLQIASLLSQWRLLIFLDVQRRWFMIYSGYKNVLTAARNRQESVWAIV